MRDDGVAQADRRTSSLELENSIAALALMLYNGRMVYLRADVSVAPERSAAAISVAGTLVCK